MCFNRRVVVFPNMFLGIPVVDNMVRKSSWYQLWRSLKKEILRVRWEKAMVDKDNRGLGVGSLYALNRTLVVN